MTMTESKRDQLVRTAFELFYRHGYHATGIDKILAEAGVSKPTMYRYFSSKEELIVAALRYWDDESLEWMKAEVRQRASEPRERVLAMFDAFRAWFEEEGFQGCMFINAVAEYQDLDDAIHQAAAEHKRKAAVHMRDLVAAAGVEDAGEMTAQLMLLIEGAIVTAHTTGNSEAALSARDIAESLLTQALDRQKEAAATARREPHRSRSRRR